MLGGEPAPKPTAAVVIKPYVLNRKSATVKWFVVFPCTVVK